mgnify:CR=1 FL=1
MAQASSQYYDGYMQYVREAGRSRKVRVVTIGGGTGHFVLLSGLKKHPLDLAAIVSMADDGGSTGVLRDEMGVLPPGGVRQCLAALSQETKVLRELFSYRFSVGGMRGHSFGNIFLAPLEKVSGSFSAAVKEAGRVLAIAGEVIPVTEGDMRLVIHLNDGTKLSGEKFLDADERLRQVGVANISLLNPVMATPLAVEKIQAADVICLGPGDLYGSVLPPLLVPQIATAIRDSHALVIYTANLTNKHGQTDEFTADDYVRAIHRYLGAHRIGVVLCNSEPPAAHLLARYEAQEGKNMMVACKPVEGGGYELLSAPILSQETIISKPQDALDTRRSFIRHDSTRLASALMHIIDEKFSAPH